jgi:hypothetical protein
LAAYFQAIPANLAAGIDLISFNISGDFLPANINHLQTLVNNAV